MSLDAHVVVTRPAGFRLDATVSVADGEVLAVLGPNGAGKSTLLRSLSGLVPLSGGRIAVGGEIWDDPVSGAWRPVARGYRYYPGHWR